MKRAKQIALITGATSGFGKLFAQKTDKQIKNSVDEIWIVGRRHMALMELSENLNKPTVLFPLDLMEKESLDIISKRLQSENVSVKMLVNAAGFGINTDFEENSAKDVHNMVALNCMALTDLTKICLPYMSKNSRIVNFASVAAFMPQPGFSVYAATKSYVLSFSRSLNKELNKKGIFVTAVCPGPSETEFFDIATRGNNYPKYKKLFWLNAEDVVNRAFKDMINKKEKSVYSLPMKMLEFITKLVPHKLLMPFADAFNEKNEA